MKPVVLTVDAGITGTGIAAWNYFDWENPDKLHFTSQLFQSKHHNDWTLVAQEIVDAIPRWTFRQNFKVVKIYIEYPQAFQSSLGIAAINRGDIFKLVFLIGYIRGVFPEAEFTPVFVSSWKGQLPKKEVERRCKLIIPEKDWMKSSHLWDSIGIGLYLKGKL
jgi:hypothetical protein